MNRFVIAEPEKCIGCRTYEVACPFGAMEMASITVKQQNLGSQTVRSSRPRSINATCAWTWRAALPA